MILNGLKEYSQEVESKVFPTEENWFGMKDNEFDELVQLLERGEK